MGVITFNGIASDSLGIVVEHPPNRTIPERNVTVVEVPGRNRDVIIDNGNYKNVKREYEIAIGSDYSKFEEVANNISKWITSSGSYARLEDTYDPDHFRMARVSGETDIENILAIAGRAKVVFDCGPQRFLFSGEESVSFSKSGHITNPTNFTAYPKIQIKVEKGVSGTLTIGKSTVTVKSTGYDDYLKDNTEDYILDSNGNKIGVSIVIVGYIDSEIGYAYSTDTSTAAAITVNDFQFPVLKPGDNYISFTGGIREVTITPNWWEI